MKKDVLNSKIRLLTERELNIVAGGYSTPKSMLSTYIAKSFPERPKKPPILKD